METNWSVGIAIIDGLSLGVLVLAALLSPLLGYLVHCALEKYCYIPHALRFCRKSGLEPESWICGPAFDTLGVKTEYSIVEVHCVDGDGQRRLVRLLVRVRGVKAVLYIEPPLAKAARIEAVAPDMPMDVRRWFLEQTYGIPSVQEQDWDLCLANWDYLPLLIEYSEDDANVLEKRFEAFSALMVLQASESIIDRKKLNQEIERVVLGNRDFAHKVCEWLGATEMFIVKQILDEQIPQDVPEWMLEEAKRRRRL